MWSAIQTMARTHRINGSAAAHLNSQNAAGPGGEWVIANLARVEPELQSLLLTEMSSSKSKDVLAQVPALVTRLDAKLGAPVLRALSNRCPRETLIPIGQKRPQFSLKSAQVGNLSGEGVHAPGDEGSDALTGRSAVVADFEDAPHVGQRESHDQRAKSSTRSTALAVYWR